MDYRYTISDIGNNRRRMKTANSRSYQQMTNNIQRQQQRITEKNYDSRIIISFGINVNRLISCATKFGILQLLPFTFYTQQKYQNYLFRLIVLSIFGVVYLYWITCHSKKSRRCAVESIIRLRFCIGTVAHLLIGPIMFYKLYIHQNKETFWLLLIRRKHAIELFEKYGMELFMKLYRYYSMETYPIRTA
ncbi:hypothetical protein SNEBB_008166 [Seison nebaliae]|nr:hypothetical protein SNEBB_008166 [Seison nebaliae]